MQRLYILAFVFLVTVSAKNCTQKNSSNEVYKGRLEIKAICMNYTISLLEGNMDSSKIVGNWTDETTKKNYSKVFALENPCNFPASIKQGDEFYFIIDTVAKANCAVCMAYYPVPGKKLPIKIIQK